MVRQLQLLCIQSGKCIKGKLLNRDPTYTVHKVFPVNLSHFLICQAYVLLWSEPIAFKHTMWKVYLLTCLIYQTYVTPRSDSYCCYMYRLKLMLSQPFYPTVIATNTIPPSCVLPCRGEGALLCVSLEDKSLGHCRTVKFIPNRWQLQCKVPMKGKLRQTLS